MVDTRVDTITNISSYYCVKSHKLNRHYKHKTSGFDTWDQKSHAENYLIFPHNMGEYLSIDELSLSKGELYTFVTNKNGKGKQGTLVAVIEGTKSEDIQKVLEEISKENRLKVKEVTLDMAKNMESSARNSFPNARLVTDRFHVVKLALDALQHMRVKQRWEEMDKENTALAKIKMIKKELEDAHNQKETGKDRIEKLQKAYKEAIVSIQQNEFENGDTPKQLLARSRYILAKKENQWTQNQQQRANILFENYPLIEKAYKEVMKFRNIYEKMDLNSAKRSFLEWIEEIKKNERKEFYSVANTISNNLDNILNFFYSRNTNANAESFNSKIKLFRTNLRGVIDTKFFLFRLSKLFA